MSRVTMGAMSRPQLTIALRQYLSELEEIIKPIQSEAKFAAVSPKIYVPNELAAEYEFTKRSLAIVKSF